MFRNSIRKSTVSTANPGWGLRQTGRWIAAATLCVVSIGAGPVRDARAFDPVSAAAMVYQGYQGVTQILQTAGVSKQKAVWFFKGMRHTWWGCVYQDGTTVFNNFRSYRNEYDVMEYFTGQNRGDCDSIVQSGGGWQNVCYGPSGASRMVAQHGQIVNVYACCPAD